MNTSGPISSPTPEEQGTPHLGVSPPRTILDLRVERDASDTLLRWSPVQEDIYGDSTTIQEYRVYSSSVGPLFLLDEAHRLATVADSAAPSYRHVGAAAGPEVRFYLVISQDSAGIDSGTGAGLPRGISDLAIRPLPGNQLRLSWSPVSTDVDGNPLVVDHYVVYGSQQPFSRTEISSMTPVRDRVDATTVDLQGSEGAFFSVLAVDRRGSVSPF